MNRELLRYAIDEMAKLPQEFGPSSGSLVTPGVPPAVFCLLARAASVLRAIQGSAVEAELRRKAERYRLLTGAGTDFERSCEEARAFLGMAHAAADAVLGNRYVRPHAIYREKRAGPGIDCLRRAIAASEPGAAAGDPQFAGRIRALQSGWKFLHEMACDTAQAGLVLPALIRQLQTIIPLAERGLDKWKTVGAEQNCCGILVPPAGFEDVSPLNGVVARLANFHHECEAENLRGGDLILRCSEAAANEGEGIRPWLITLLLHYWPDLLSPILAAAREMEPSLQPWEAAAASPAMDIGADENSRNPVTVVREQVADDQEPNTHEPDGCLLDSATIPEQPGEAGSEQIRMALPFVSALSEAVYEI